jgi:hypothetical protein
MGITAVGLIAFDFLVLLISSISKSPLITIFISSIVYLIPEAARSIFLDQTGFIAVLIRFSYAEVIKTGRLFKMFKAYDILNMPVLYPVAAVFVMVISSVIAVSIICRRFRNSDIAA